MKFNYGNRGLETTRQQGMMLYRSLQRHEKLVIKFLVKSCKANQSNLFKFLESMEVFVRTIQCSEKCCNRLTRSERVKRLLGGSLYPSYVDAIKGDKLCGGV